MLREYKSPNVDMV